MESESLGAFCKTCSANRYPIGGRWVSLCRGQQWLRQSLLPTITAVIGIARSTSHWQLDASYGAALLDAGEATFSFVVRGVVAFSA